METREESSAMVVRLFGREPSVEDLRSVGLWSYAAAWLAENREAARELATLRLDLAIEAAVHAAKGAGRGDADRFVLVAALTQLPGSTTREQAIEDEANRLLANGKTIRERTHHEQSNFAQRFNLAPFEIGLRSTEGDRQNLMQEALNDLDQSLMEARAVCPALRTMRLFLRTALAVEANEMVLAEGIGNGAEEPFVSLGYWLTADLALISRRSSAYGTAWFNASRASGDALSRAVAGLTGATMSGGVGDAFAEDPFALPMALAMTSAPEHAAALLAAGAQAQGIIRAKATQALGKWTAQAAKIQEFESKLGISIAAPSELREGYKEFGTPGSLDLFKGWHAIQEANIARAALREAIETALKTEMVKRQEGVQKAHKALDAARKVFDAAVSTAWEKHDAARIAAEKPEPDNDEGAQRGCIFGFGAGCSVMATYLVVGFIVGTGGLIGQIAPLVVGIAALPVAAAIMVQIAYAMRRAAKAAEAAKRRAAADARLSEARAEAEKQHGPTITERRNALEEAESSLAAFEMQVSETKIVA